MKKLLFLVSISFFYASWGLTTLTNTVDFATGTNTNGWTMTSSGWVSPAYPSPLSAITVSGTNFADGAALNVANHANAITLAATGEAGVTAFSAVYTVSKLLPASDLQVTNVIDGGFEIKWSAVPDAVGYRLNFYSNILEGASAGNEVFAENFSKIVSKGSSTPLAEDFNENTDTKAGWFFERCYYGKTPVSNVVQVGSSEVRGWLALPVPENIYGSGYTLKFSAWRNKEAGVGMPVSVVSQSNITNWLGTVSLATNATSFLLELPALSATDTIYFHSSTNKKDGRVVLDSVRILEGYTPGTLNATCFESVRVNGTSFATNGMAEVDCQVAVMALAVEAKDDSDESARVDLPLANPPLMPILRAWPINLADGVYETDFTEIAGVDKKDTAWYNGVSPLPYWMGYRDNGTLLDKISLGSTNVNYSGLFRFHDAGQSYGEALGWRGTSERSLYTGIAFVNADERYRRRNFRLAFRPCQWNYRNKVPMTNQVEYLVTNELVSTVAAGDWLELKSLEITPPYTESENGNGAVCWWGDSMAADLPGVTLSPGEYLIVRFVNLKASSSGGVGIAQFKLTSERQPMTSCVIFR